MADRLFRMLVVGVGGQGVLVATKVLGNAARQSGQAVHVGQIHGMSQRGGSVESTLVIGDAQTSFVGAGEADVVLGFEPLETLRALPRMSARTTVVTSTSPVSLPALSVHGQPYPQVSSIVARIRAVAGRVVAFDAAALAERAGDARCLNVVMLGVVQGLLLCPFADGALAAAVDRQSPPRVADSNRLAFASGQEFGVECRSRPASERCCES